MRSSVPPHPISMSSLWQPRTSRLSDSRAANENGCRGTKLRDGVPRANPGGAARVPELVQPLRVLQRVHRSPEAVVGVRDELLAFDQPVEGLVDEFLARLNQLEHLALHHEVAAVDADVRARDVAYAAHRAVV